MAILAVGSVAYDTVETPAERRERQLGGSASYFALAAAPLGAGARGGGGGRRFPARPTSSCWPRVALT